jgi:4-hydroxybenzoate polyprenyltransferase
VFIAAGGYVINDYFDVPIDQYNKPNKMIVTKHISEDHAFYLYLVLSALGIIAALIVAISIGRFTLIFYQIFPVVVLWIYAQSFKKVFLVGNIMVAFLSGLVIIVPAMYEINLKEIGIRVENALFINGLLRISIAYSLFAFLSTLIREIIKDIEDIEGDKRCGAQTIPIRLGLNPTKGIIAFLFLILLGGISVFLPQLYKANEVVPFLYILTLLIFPLLYMLVYLFLAKSKEHFSRLSFTLKVFMLSGMITMVYFFINYAQ